MTLTVVTHTSWHCWNIQTPRVNMVFSLLMSSFKEFEVFLIPQFRLTMENEHEVLANLPKAGHS